MFSISELPRQEGLVLGSFRARHSSPTFSLEGYGFRFVDGVTIAPVEGRIPDRLHAAYGPDVTFEPCDRDSGELALLALEDRGAHQDVLDAHRRALDALFVAEEKKSAPPQSDLLETDEAPPPPPEASEARIAPTVRVEDEPKHTTKKGGRRW